jgi:hypothetical protein
MALISLRSFSKEASPRVRKPGEFIFTSSHNPNNNYWPKNSQRLAFEKNFQSYLNQLLLKGPFHTERLMHRLASENWKVSELLGVYPTLRAETLRRLREFVRANGVAAGGL